MTANGQRKLFQFLDLAKSEIETGYNAVLGELRGFARGMLFLVFSIVSHAVSVHIRGHPCPKESRNVGFVVRIEMGRKVSSVVTCAGHLHLL